MQTSNRIKLLPMAVLLALISCLPVFAQNTEAAAICQTVKASQNVNIREMSRVSVLMTAHQRGDTFRTYLSRLNKAIANKDAMSGYDLEEIAEAVDLPRFTRFSSSDVVLGMTNAQAMKIQQQLRTRVANAIDGANRETLEQLQAKFRPLYAESKVLAARMDKLDCNAILKHDIGSGPTPCNAGELALWAKITGTWEASYGKVTFSGSCENVSGSWKQGEWGERGDKLTGLINDGRVDGSSLSFKYEQYWNNKSGSDLCRLSTDGKKLECSYMGTLQR